MQGLKRWARLPEFCTTFVLPALLQKLGSEAFCFCAGKVAGKFGGNFAGFFGPIKLRPQKSGNFRITFVRNFAFSWVLGPHF